MVKYTHIKEPVIGTQLEDEIRDSSITVALDFINTIGSQVDVHFKAGLSSGEQDTLGTTVSGHVADLNAVGGDIVITSTLDGGGNIVPDTPAPLTNDGETLTIQGNMANVTGNRLLNWTMSYTLGADTDISERFIVPSGVTVAIEFVQGYSSAVPFSAELSWYRGSGFRINPAIDPSNFAIQEVVGDYTPGDTVITLRNVNTYQFGNLQINKRYGFATPDGKSCVRKVVSKKSSDKTVTLSAGIPFIMVDGTKFALVDRPIARIGGDANNSLMDFEVSPSFKGDGDRFLELVIKNESLTDSGDVFAIVNGWTTPTTGGTIPGEGGEAEVDADV